jgi:putative membrane protein
VRNILTQQLFTVLLACAVVATHGRLYHFKVTLTASPVSLMGVSLAIFLGFRINASYDRYWEARKLWGAVLVEARNLARQALTLTRTGAEVRPFVLGLAGFAAAMRNQLRQQDATNGLDSLLPPALVVRLATLRYPASAVALWLGQELRRLRDAGSLDPMALTSMDGALSQMTAALGGCERIANTPLPFTYSVILHRSTYLYCWLLPFGLVDAIGLLTPLVVAFVSYTFFALEALSDEIEEPFGTMPNDLALDAIAAAVHSSLCELLGDNPPAQPVPDANFLLS